MKNLILTFAYLICINSVAWSQCFSDCSDGQNTRFGDKAGASLTSGISNTFLGIGTGTKTTTGSGNTFVGKSAGTFNTSGEGNIFVGNSAGVFNMTGADNVFIGKYAGFYNKASFNTFIGAQAGYNNTFAQDNTFIGNVAGYNNTTGAGNTFMGAAAGIKNTTAGQNTFIGGFSGFANTTGERNTFLGSSSGISNTIGSENTFLGTDAGKANVSGFRNTFVGEEAGFSNSNASGNTFVGYIAGRGNTSGIFNTFLGIGAGSFNTTGENNTFLGATAGRDNTTGKQNTFVGEAAGLFNQTGSGNIFLGHNAGFYEQGSNKLYIDNTDTDKPLIYGDFSTNIVAVNGALGVGIQKPERPIHLRASNAIFRIDRDSDDPGFAIVRYDAGFANVWKSFYFYTKGSGVNEGKFVIADWGTNVSGPSTPRFVIANNGNVGIGDFLVANPSQKLTVSGNVLATGSFITSDKRFKKNIQTIPSAMDRLSQINGVTYAFETQKFAGKGLPEGQALGLIAQEVEKVFPELVVEDAEGFKAVNYDGLIPVLIEALKAQKQDFEAQIQGLRAEIKSLQSGQASSNTEEEIKPAQLFQNQPNPFDQSTLIRYFLPENTTQALMIITDLQGKEVNRQILTGRGENSLKIEAGSLSKGIYLYTLIADGQVIDTKKMWLSK